MGLVKVEVVKDGFGNYKKGDVIEMFESTALACEKVGVVKLEGSKTKAKKSDNTEE